MAVRINSEGDIIEIPSIYIDIGDEADDVYFNGQHKFALNIRVDRSVVNDTADIDDSDNDDITNINDDISADDNADNDDITNINDDISTDNSDNSDNSAGIDVNILINDMIITCYERPNEDEDKGDELEHPFKSYGSTGIIIDGVYVPNVDNPELNELVTELLKVEDISKDARIELYNRCVHIAYHIYTEFIYQTTILYMALNTFRFR